jgi:hypothetical protein
MGVCEGSDRVESRTPSRTMRLDHKGGGVGGFPSRIPMSLPQTWFDKLHNQPTLACLYERLCAALNLEFGKDIIDMFFDGWDAYHKVCGNIGVGKATSYQPQHLKLARRKGVGMSRCAARRRGL